MRRVFPAVFCFLIAVAAHAQPLFNAVTNSVQPDPAIARVFGDPPNIRTRQVTLNAQYFATQAGTPGGDLIINLFPDLTVTALHDVVEQGQSATKWRGRLAGQNEWGRAILAVTGGHIAGLVQKDGRVFLIKPITDQVHLVSEVRQRDFPIEAMPLTPGTFQRTQQSAADNDGNYTLRVMLVMDSAYSVICSYSWLEAIFESVFEANLDDVWSNFTTSTIRADVVIYCAQHSATGGDLNADLTWVHTDATVAAERNARAADIVSYIIPSGSYCGRGYVNGPPVVAADEADAFSVVVGSCSLSNYSLAHEIGHNMGMLHDRTTEGGGDPAACNYGYWITLGSTPVLRTVMAYDCSTGCPRIGLHSYPAAIYIPFFGTFTFGVACGSPTGADNVQQLEQAAPVMEAFR